MILVALLLTGLVGAWLIRRRGRRNELAGRVAERPTYTTEPPSRRVGRRSYEAL